MYRALYEYKTDLQQYLSFQTGDQFTVLDNSQKDWFLVQNGYGEIGYIPKNYVQEDKVSISEVLKSIDRAIEVIHYDASSKGGKYTHIQRENLRKLIEHRDNVKHSADTQQGSAASSEVPSCSRRAAPAPPAEGQRSRSSSEVKPEQPHCSSMGLVSNSQIPKEIVKDNQAQSPEVSDMSNRDKQSALSLAMTCPKVDTTDTGSSPFPSPSKSNTMSKKVQGETTVIDYSTVAVPANLGDDLVDVVRNNTGVSYKLSCVAVETMLAHIATSIPEVSQLMDRINRTFGEVNEGSQAEEEMNADYERLTDLFVRLTECKDDSQQRGWFLHEDEHIISANLTEMLSILENAKPSVCRKVLESDSFESVHNLVQYYQMENRVSLRLMLLQVFGALCSLEGGSAVITMLLCSVLTTELAKELQQNIDDVQRSSYVALLLSMIFSTGEPVPASLHDHLNADFLNFIFENIENPVSGDHEDKLSDVLVNLVLAFNLHLHVPAASPMLQVIEERRTVKVFTEKILLLFNRDEDPVRLFEGSSVPNSVMKVLQDLYSRPGTAGILYTNDAKVLLDIILRHLIDLSPCDKLRSSHLKLMQLYLEHADYKEHRHRSTELRECLQRIQAEEEDTGDDKHIVQYIFTNLTLFND
ncbi:NCK-interacting protein with SH3 domain-like isoform X2 [Mya arenaria]|uniref:NCK-interacting protein with SH3 domain-like isoform X2 n=1 Tax=Mya arenaria TaxID=6604 RepID=UPI0022E219D9|nr:NCK-interacting protein with SH3 domain-like isoform X2 [Mya arenaria]